MRDDGTQNKLLVNGNVEVFIGGVKKALINNEIYIMK
jgi:hypothetical protein